MILKTMAVGAAALFLIAPALADDAPPDNADGRYIFSKQADGFVRLDTKTGEVALCSQKTVGWACEAAPEDRAVLENEIARLRGENAALKKDFLARGLPLPAGIMPEPLAQNDEPPSSGPPSDCPAMPTSTAWWLQSAGPGIASLKRLHGRKSRS